MLKRGAPLTSSELAEIENGSRLPDAYRRFITTVTSEIDDTKLVHPRRATKHLRGQPFPFTPAEAERAMNAAAKHFRAGLGPGPARPVESFDFADSVLGRMVFVDDYPVADVWLQGNEDGDGALMLEDQGDGWLIALVIDGPLRNTVWHSGEYGWLPHFYVDAHGSVHAHDFESWLAVQLALLEDS